jgi:hypothetical protein
MGRGIAGIIPVRFYVEERLLLRNMEKILTETDKNFFDFYNETQGNDPRYSYYEIKGEVLLTQLKPFFIEFHTLISDEIPEETGDIFNDKYDGIVRQTDFEAFTKHFGEHTFPSYYTRMPWYAFSPPASIISTDYVLFYNGSYKVAMEEYTTLLHMKKLLAKAIDNPLSKIALFGEFG